MASAGYPRPARGLPQTPSLPISPPKGIAPSRATLPRPAFLFLRQTKSKTKQTPENFSQSLLHITLLRKLQKLI